MFATAHIVVNMANGHIRKISDNFRALFKSSNKDATSAEMSSENASPKKAPSENASPKNAPSETALPKKAPPPSFSKFFKTTKNARKLMDPQARVCELDINDRKRVLVYSTPKVRAMRLVDAMPWNKAGMDEMLWSQATLYEASQKGTVIVALF